MASPLSRIFAGIKNNMLHSGPTKSDELLDAHRMVSWIYDFWRILSPYAYARMEDNVVILPPNLVYKTNATGARLVSFVNAGGCFADIPGFCARRAAEIDSFFKTIKAVYEGRKPVMDRIAYSFDFTSLPVLGEIAVTYDCNNRCRFCYASCGGKDMRSQLDTAALKKIIDIFKDEAKIPFFSFTGGEPLLRNDLEELAAYATSRGLRINLISNGTLATAKRARSLFQAGFRTAQVSIESPVAAIHDGLCGVEGCFDKTVAGIRALIDAGLSVQTNSTLTGINRRSLLDLPGFVRSLGVKRMSMNLFIPAGSGLDAGDLFVPYSEAGSFVDEVRKSASLAGTDFFWYSPTPLCIYNPIARGLGNKSCAACDGLLSVSPTGDLLPCSSCPDSVGNLASDNFTQLWSGEKSLWYKHKNYAREECKACDSFTACQGACPLYWNHVGYEELERFGKGSWKARRP